MRRKINIRQTFQAIRQLPLEVSIQQVEGWIRQEPLKSPGFFQQLKWRFFKWLRT